MFRVGQKVVCVDVSNQINSIYGGPFGKVVLHEIYTIINFSSSKYLNNGGGGLILKEVRNTVYPDGKERGFSTHRFRPIDEQFGERIASEIEEEINQEELVTK